MPRESVLARFADVFLQAFAQRLRRRRRKAKDAVRPPPKERWPPPIPGWERPSHWPPPTTYATKEEWLAACESDQKAEEQDLMDHYLMHGVIHVPRSA